MSTSNISLYSNALGWFVAATFAVPAFAVDLQGDEQGRKIASQVYNRADGDIVKRKLRIELIDAKGDVRERSAIVLRQRDDATKQTVFMYDSPRSIRGTAYLSTDRLQKGAEDDQFLYLPALKKERRIPASERGDYFLGTDFSYEDVRNELKFTPGDYRFEFQGEMSGLVGGGSAKLIKAVVVSDSIANELGYHSIDISVDPSNWMVMQAKYYDKQGQAIKTTDVADVREVNGIATAHKITVTNHQTGHVTRFNYSDVEYLSSRQDDLFRFDTISQGPRRFQ